MNRAKAYQLFLLIAIVCLFSCKKQNAKDENKWDMTLNFQVDTIINITSESAVVKGTITFSASQQNIWNFGVNYDTISSFINDVHTSTVNTDYKKSISISDTIKNLRQTTTYYVRIWTLINPSQTATGQHDFYSAIKHFQTIKHPLQLNKLLPDSGTYRDQFTITGKGFSRKPGDHQVFVNGMAAIVTAAFDTSLQVIVPKKCMTGTVTVKLGTETINGPQFKYIDEPYVVYTFAGGARGYADGVGTNAMFSNVFGLTFDKDGNLLVGESTHIRKVTPDGIVSTIAGSGTKGYLDGTGAIAKFYYVTDLKIDDATGNIFVVDNFNSCIRVVKEDGSIVKTFAGIDTFGYKDDLGTKARFGMPNGIAKDKHGNLFITDLNNNRIRKIDGFGQVTTFAGDGNDGCKAGLGKAASIGLPSAISFDMNKYFYVSGFAGHTIFQIDTIGQVTIFAGQGSGKTASFGDVSGIVIDPQNNLFISDQGNSCLYKLSASGQLTLFSGNNSESKIVNGGISKARFKQLWGITMDQSGNFYVSDGDCIRKIEKVN